MNNFWRILFIFQAKLDHLITYLVKMLCFLNGIGLISHSRIGYLLVCFQQRWQISFILGGIYSVNVKMLTRGRSLCVFTILMYFISVFLKPSPEVSVFLIKLLKKLINEKTNGFAKTADIETSQFFYVYGAIIVFHFWLQNKLRFDHQMSLKATLFFPPNI